MTCKATRIVHCSLSGGYFTKLGCNKTTGHSEDHYDLKTEYYWKK